LEKDFDDLKKERSTLVQERRAQISNDLREEIQDFLTKGKGIDYPRFLGA